MELGESIRRRGAWLVAGAGALALVAAGPVAVRADQSNDNSDTTVAAGGDPIVIPVTGALQVNLTCPVNLNLLADESDVGNCAPDAQSNANSSETMTGGDGSSGLLGGTLVAPVTAAGQVNLNCPINVNVVSSQRRSGNCAPGPQSNSNSADTRVHGGGALADVLGGPVVAPVTSGVGLNVTCPTDVNVLSAEEASGDCVDAVGPIDGPTVPTAGAPAAAPPADQGPVPTSGGPLADTHFADEVAAADAPADSSQLPGPPVTGALGIGGVAGGGGLPALGALVLAVLAAATTAVRRFHRLR